MTDVVEIFVPRESNNDEFVTLLRWYLDDGDEVRADQVVADIEGSKATFEVTSSSSGFLRRVVAEGAEVEVGGMLCRVFPSFEAARTWRDDDLSGDRDSPADSYDSATAAQAGFVRFSKRAQALLEEHGLEPSRFDGRGLVRAADVLAVLGQGQARPAGPPAAAAAATRAAPANRPLDLPGRRVPLSPTKRTEARYIGASYASTLQSSVTRSVATAGLKEALSHGGAFDGNSTALIVHEVARLLKKYPVFNACHDAGDIYMYDEVNIGIAVDAGGGLKVPVIRDADSKSPAEIAEALREYLVAYVNDELSAEDQTGGTFTVTDLSGDRVASFQPLINRGQSAILGIGAEFFPHARGGGFFNLILQFDHQLAEGRSAAALLNDLATRLEGYEKAFDHARPDAAEPHCSKCYRPYSELRDLKHFLVQTIDGDGGPTVTCTGCLQGW